MKLSWLENKEPFAIGHAIVAHKGVLYVHWAANPGLLVGGVSVHGASTDKTLMSWVTLKYKSIRGGSALTG